MKSIKAPLLAATSSVMLAMAMTASADAIPFRDDVGDEGAQQFAQDLPPVIIDKTPLNIFELGFAARVLPSARFVFLSRHPLDVGLSAFATHFFAAHPYSNSLASIGDMTRAVYRSADNYERRLGPAFRRQSYAALVSSPETQIRSLLDHLDLAWDPACLSPQDRVGMVRTASVTQVRAPITRSAIGKWTRYEKELQPLVKALGGPDWIDDWEGADQAAG